MIESEKVPEGFDIDVNGETRAARAGMTVEELLLGHDLDPDVVVVERNGAILRRGQFADTALAPGDAIEIVHFVGGG
ncbi:hypothetical protein BH18GEM1_BH18GEM1_06720 [soil metagenome]